MSAVAPRIFVSYSRRDRKALDRLRTHLRPLVRDDEIDLWDDSRIRAGDVWRAEIARSLESIAAGVLLVSADFLASDFIREQELPPIFAAWEQRGIKLYWVLLSACDFGRYESLKRLQAVNPDLKPLSKMNRDQKEKIWAELAAAISEDFKKFHPSDEPPPISSVPFGIIARDQIDVLRKAATYVYRARNLSRDLEREPLGASDGTDDLRELRDVLADLVDLLYRERAILPDAIFRVIHTLKRTLFDFIAEIDALRRSGATANKPVPKTRSATIRVLYQGLNDDYEMLLQIIQKRLGVDE